MKYPKEYLNEIKLRLKVSQVVGKTVQLKKRGKEFIGLSPFKNEKTPSFTVNDDKEFYHYFSTGEHGNIFDFLMKTKSVGFGEAVKILAAEAGMQPYRFSNFDKKKDLRFQTYKKIFKDKIIPEDIILKSPYYIKQCEGFSPKFKAWSNISGIDLIRNKNGEYLVLEDNLRVPSGVSYMLENRMVMRDVFPELFTRYKVSSIHQYTNKLYNCMVECIPKKTANPHMVVLTPGIYNSAYFEHSFLAEQMGIALVEGKDLFVEDDNVYMKTVKGPLKVDCIYRRLDDSFLDPKVFNKESLIGVPGLFKCWLKKNVGILNAIGTGVADDKVVYSYVNKMITYYLGEQPILNQVETYLCHEEQQKKYVLENLSKLVVKPANASGGYGLMIGPKAPKKEIEEVRQKILKNPREFIAQPLEVLSTGPTITNNNIEPRHVDLRPFVLTGKSNYVTSGGLTRVALRKGSTIVNSSQGGGSKDTLIVG